MIVPERWLRSFCDPKIAGEKLADRLTMAGLEVESYAPIAPQLANVVVAEVLAVAKHPNADRLSVCTVNAGKDRLRVVCGAPNVRVGMKAPLARIGTKEVRGVASEGMLASARDLGLSEDHSGLLELPASATPGGDVRKALGLDDHVLTFKLTPNRADGLSILGIAREVAALTGAKLKQPPIRKVPPKNKSVHPVRISAPEGCGRFAGRVIRGVDAAARTPAWMRERLERAGQRPISALVDVTNYVMLELGRPLHVYDLEKLHGPIDVRWGRAGERVLLLNEQEVEVDPSVLCITDDSGVIGLGGIMGGESTKADAGTKNIFLESAFFFPQAIQGRARRYGFASDASHRFERGVDPQNNLDGIEYATRLILDICGGEPGPTLDTRKRLPARRPVRMRIARAQKVLGIPVSAKQMAAVFSRLRFQFRKSAQAFVVSPPPYRFDLEIEEDLIEEVARLHGFERIAAHPPRAAARMLRAPETSRSLHALRELLAAADYREVINFSFVPPAWEADFAGAPPPIRLLNPINSEHSVMRTTLLGSLLANVAYNHARKVPRVRVFEVGRVFLRDAAAPDGPLSVAGVRQPVRIGAAAFGPALAEQWGTAQEEKDRAADFFDVKADLEALGAPAALRFEKAPHPAFHPGRSARVLLGGAAAGWLGELHPRWQAKYGLPGSVVLFEVDAEAFQARALPHPHAPSRYPAVVRDIAVVVDAGVPAQAMLNVMAGGKAPIVREITVFDLYQGESLGNRGGAGRKSLAFRVVMQHTERTLTDAEADAARDALVALLAREFSASLRS